MIRPSVFASMLLVCLVGTGLAQTSPDSVIVPLIVDKGFPIQVLLTEKLHFKENEQVRATVVEPVYAFDREVIPSGTQLEGKITTLHKPGKWKRISTMLAGNFTPLRDPEIAFHTLVLPGGRRISIETSVVPGTEKIVGISHFKQSLTPHKTAPQNLLKKGLLGLSPYQPQNVPAGTRLTAVLEQPIDFGEAVFENADLEDLGSDALFNSTVKVRLVTSLDSRITLRGAPVEAQLIRPLFSESHRLVLPAGARLRGTVTEVTPSRSWHRNGQLSFSFTTLSPSTACMCGQLYPQEVDGSLVSIQVTHEMKDLHIQDKNTTRILESKTKRLIAPAWSLIKAERSIGSTADSLETALLGAYRGKFLKQVAGGGDSGFGLPGSISGAMIPPVGIGLSFFGAARSVYSNFLGRGRDVTLPNNTTMEIRIEKRTEDIP